MQRLGATDANFLYTETDLTPNHIASVQRLALPHGVSEQAFVEDLKQYVASRAHLIPYMQRRLQFLPGNFDHPFWVQDRHFSIDNHVIEAPLRAPGTLAQLEKKVAELHAVNMDRSRPLWHIYVITGLEDGTVALYNAIHHAAIDGIAGQTALMLLMDTTIEPREIQPPAGPVSDNDDFGSLLQASFEKLVKYQLNSASRMFSNMETMRRMIQRAVDPSRQFGALAEPAPRTRFNSTIVKRRSYAVGELPLSDLKAMGKQLGCTVNDAFMAVCAGGLRRYLLRHNELPETGLIAGCPVSLRGAGNGDMGNQVTMMSVNLATQMEDPKLRLLAIAESARVGKEVTADLAGSLDAEMSLPGLPVFMTAAAAASEQNHLADVVRMPVNVVISNVPGPRETLFCNRARMLTHYPVSIPAHGVGLNITVQSYVDTLYMGITACARALPDPDLLRDDMLAAFLELQQLLLRNNNVAPIKLTGGKTGKPEQMKYEAQDAAATDPAHEDAAQDPETLLDLRSKVA
ncbi:MAG: wax ester/triacylglycerol synthase family O-acyltransferase [Pseudomonadota bacterium]